MLGTAPGKYSQTSVRATHIYSTMKFQVCIVLALAALACAEEPKQDAVETKEKRGVVGVGYGAAYSPYGYAAPAYSGYAAPAAYAASTYGYATPASYAHYAAPAAYPYGYSGYAAPAYSAYAAPAVAKVATYAAPAAAYHAGYGYAAPALGYSAYGHVY